MPTTFDTDLANLERRYLAWSRELHPDYFQLRSPEDQRLSLSLSAALNDAYNTLKDPFRRAEYLLWLLGGPSASEHRGMPEGFLEDVLELRMEIEELVEEGRAGSPRAEELLQRLEAERCKAMDNVSDSFRELEKQKAAKPPAEALRILRSQLNTVKYYDGLLRELEQALVDH
ncbi:MAG: Fe-S protein assembly co-chaperone HscB [Planctomycetota bacterium]